MKKILSTGEWAENQIKETYVQSMERLSITSLAVAWTIIIIGLAVIIGVSCLWLLKVGL